MTLISSDGAVTRLSDGSLFHRDLLPAEAARSLARHMAAFRGDTVVIFDGRPRAHWWWHPRLS